MGHVTPSLTYLRETPGRSTNVGVAGDRHLRKEEIRNILTMHCSQKQKGLISFMLDKRKRFTFLSSS